MKKISKKLLSLLMTLAIMLSNFLPIIPMTEVYASTVIDEIRITSSTTNVEPGTLPDFTAETTTEHASIDFSNSSWRWWGQSSTSWQGFGVETPTAVNDGKTHYAIDLCIDLENGYSFDENTKIYFNGVDVTSLGHSDIKIMSWGGYVGIDLGTAGTELAKYTITYDANDGTGTMNSKLVYEGESLNLQKNTFTSPEGMSFKAWKIGNTEYEEYDSYTPVSDTLVKAVWTDKYIRESRATMTPVALSSNISSNDLVFTSLEPDKYSVSIWRVFDETDTSLNTDNGKYPMNSNFISGHNYAIEFTFAASGEYYEYDEIKNISTFYLNDIETDISKAVAISGSVNRRIELTALGDNTHTVTFNTNGGSSISGQIVNHGDTAVEPVAPTKNNNVFAGWYEDPEFTIPFTFNKSITNEITLYARWTEPEQVFTITYDFNGGNRNGENSYVEHSVGYGMILSIENLIDHLGVTKPNGKELEAVMVNGTRYELNSSYLLNTNTNIQYLWQNNIQQNYTVTFKDGENVLDTRNISSGEKVSRPEQNPTKNGYTFDDWYENAEFTILFDFNKTITNNTNIYARFTQNNNQKITFQLDSATISGNVITFYVDDKTYTATIVGSGYTVNGNNIEVNLSDINNVKFAMSDNFDNSKVQLKLHDGQILIITGNNEAIFDGLNFENDNAPHLQMVSVMGGQNGENDTQNYQGNSTATLNYKVTGDIEYDEEMGTGVGFRINDITYKMDNQKAQFTEGPAYERDENGQLLLDENNDPIPVKDPETFEVINKKNGVTITGDTIKYDNNETNKVKFTFVTSWNTVIESIKINGNMVPNLPQTKEELANHYRNQAIEIDVNDIQNANAYDIEIVARMATENELYLGNFLWDYNPKGYTQPEDKILNAKLTLVEAEYNGVKYTTEDEINALGGLYNFHDAERKNKYSNDREGVGSATFPTGTKLTVKIIPDAGYQLVDFGINGGVFDSQEEIGTYTFEIQGGNFHLQATIEQVDDVVKTTSEKIKSGDIKLGGEENSMAIGSARLDVSDIELTEDQISNFKETANGYNIDNYIDISLYNTVFKGNTINSWDTQVKDLQNEATITLKLEKGVNGNEVVIVHEKHDGTYEIIPVEYDEKTKTITFKTKSFSNYAIASKTSSISKIVTKTYDPIFTWFSIFTISLIGLFFKVKNFKIN